MSSIIDLVTKFAPQVGKFVLICIVTVAAVGLLARLFFEDAKKEASHNKTDPKQPLEPQRPSGPQLAA